MVLCITFTTVQAYCREMDFKVIICGQIFKQSNCKMDIGTV